MIIKECTYGTSEGVSKVTDVWYKLTVAVARVTGNDRLLKGRNKQQRVNDRNNDTLNCVQVTIMRYYVLYDM